MAVFFIWKLEWMKILFKLTFKREVVNSPSEYDSFDYFFQVLLMNIAVWILLWILTHFSALDISVNTTHLEILQQSRLKWETRFNWRGHEFFFQKSNWAMKYLALWSPGLQNIFWKICKTLHPPSYILNVHSLKFSDSFFYHS